MKRSEALAPLSRDHHQGLFAAQRLVRATAETAAEARAAFLSFWREEGRHHFHIEEDVLLPAFERRGPADHEDVVRVLVDHVQIRRRADDLEASATADLGALHELGRMLQAHIRHEERVLFPLMEEILSADELRALGERIEEAERAG